jgi:hypothetical protein
MVDKIHREGSGPGISDKESAYYAGGPQTARRHADDELLSRGGHITSSGHNSLQDQIAEKEKREESSRFLRSLLLIQAMIDDLESRNEELDNLIREAEEELKDAEKSREEIIPKLKEAEKQLTICEKELREAEKTLEKIEEKIEAAENLKWEAMKALPKDALPSHLAQITFKVKNGGREVGSVDVAVKQKDGKYFFINPVTEQEEEVTDETQKAELEKQLKDGKKTYDTESDDMKHLIEHLHEAAHNVMVHALHADEHNEEFETAKKNYDTKKDEYEKKLKEVHDLREKLQTKGKEIEDLKNKTARYKDELGQNKIQLEKLYEERNALNARGELAKSELKQKRKELYESLQDQTGAAEKYLEALEARDDYTKKLKETWKSYQDCKKDERALREMGVALVAVIHRDPAHPESHAHMVHTVHRDESGYYYLDASDLRQNVNADSLKPGTKAVEDLSGGLLITEAVRRYDEKADKFHHTLHEFEALNKETGSLEDIEQKRKNPQSASDVLFSNEKELAPPLTGVFTDAAGQPYTEPPGHEHHHAPAVIPSKNGGPPT